MIPRQIYVNTDYDIHDPDEVFFEHECDTTDESWRCIGYICNWCKENDIEYIVASFGLNSVRMQVPNPEDRTLMRLTFTLINARRDNDMMNLIPRRPPLSV